MTNVSFLWTKVQFYQLKLVDFTLLLEIKDKKKKLNNEVIAKYSNDKEARIGSKGKNKFWFGFKKHCSVDMQSGLINKVAVPRQI